MKINKIILIVIITIISCNFAFATSEKENNSKDDLIPAKITKEYRKMTLDLMQVLGFYEGYDMVTNNITTRLVMYDPNIDKSFSDSIRNTSNNSAYLDSLVNIYSRYFSLNDLKVLHKYFFSSTFRKAEIVGMKIQNEVDAVLNQIDLDRKAEIKNMYLKTGRKVPEFLEPKKPESIDEPIQNGEKK